MYRDCWKNFAGPSKIDSNRDNLGKMRLILMGKKICKTIGSSFCSKFGTLQKKIKNMSKKFFKQSLNVFGILYVLIFLSKKFQKTLHDHRKARDRLRLFWQLS